MTHGAPPAERRRWRARPRWPPASPWCPRRRRAAGSWSCGGPSVLPRCCSSVAQLYRIVIPVGSHRAATELDDVAVAVVRGAFDTQGRPTWLDPELRRLLG